MLRPLAGFRFLNGQGVGGKHHGTGRFPSPCGVLVLKFLRNDTNPCRAGDVSVPLRGSPILASPVATGEVASNASRWGRLCLAYTSDAMKVYSLRPWRPLRHTACATSPALAGEARGTLRPLAGFWFLNLLLFGWNMRSMVVSVPLRGSGS